MIFICGINSYLFFLLKKSVYGMDYIDSWDSPLKTFLIKEFCTGDLTHFLLADQQVGFRVFLSN